jgi:hypothetical protein
VEGAYQAIAFTIETPDTVFDELTPQTSLRLTLHGDQTTSGAFTVGDLRTDLAGEWDTAASTLHLHLGVPTFLNGLPFTVSLSELVGTVRLQDGTITLRLRHE